MSPIRLYAALAIMASASACAAEQNTSPDTLIRARLTGEGVAAKQITPSKVGGLYEVVLTDGTILYASPDGRYMIVGDMLDTATKTNVTKDLSRKLLATDYPSLPHDLTIKTGKKGASNKVFVVADPNCGYCHKYYQTLKAIPDLEVETLLVGVLGQDSQAKAMSIQCAQNREAALEAMMSGKPIQPAVCTSGEQTLRASHEWLKQHPIKTTPTTYFSTGKIEVGQLSEQTVQQNLR